MTRIILASQTNLALRNVPSDCNYYCESINVYIIIIEYLLYLQYNFTIYYFNYIITNDILYVKLIFKVKKRTVSLYYCLLVQKSQKV